MLNMTAAKVAGGAALQFVLGVAKGLFRSNSVKTDSLVRFTRSTRVEPIALVDQRLVHLPYMGDVMQTMSSIFLGYYLQAVSLAVNVGRINVIRLLDALNPHRDVADASAMFLADSLAGKAPRFLSNESYMFGLPSMESVDDAYRQQAVTAVKQREALKASMESPVSEEEKDWGDAFVAIDQAKDAIKNNPGLHAAKDYLQGDAGKLINDGSIKGSAGADDKLQKLVTEATNLSVGKLVEVTIQDGDKKASFPIMVRIISTIVNGPTLVHILSDQSRWYATAKERFHLWRAGQLEFIRDIVLCQDLIDEHRRALLNDKSGAYKEILDRRAGNAVASTLTGSPSIATASNIVVLSKQSAKEIEQATGGRFSDVKFRTRLFDRSYVMLMAVIDPEWEHITIYHRGIALPTEMMLKELKATNKGTGPDISEILKAYQLGQSPSNL